MNITSSQLQSTNLAAQSLLARSLAQLPNLATALADDSDGSDNSSDLSGLSGLSTQLQSGITSLQTTSDGLDTLGALLKQMGSLARAVSDPSNSASAQAEAGQKFAALQTQLREIVGGSSSVIGGADAAGSGLFGENSDGSANPANLQQGPMLALIAQSSDGSFTLSAADASKTVADATNQVAQAGSAVDTKSSQLMQEAIRLQIGQMNLASVLAPIQNGNDAQQANQLTAASIISLGGSALNIQGAPNAAAALQLVQM
ncbi:MAG TPA: hypothetical protein VHD32_00175 [Candidatus Didemnitutus sp.]|nr:hypothetical protein [Candidatus Didemnitutus sp.]